MQSALGAPSDAAGRTAVCEARRLRFLRAALAAVSLSRRSCLARWAAPPLLRSSPVHSSLDDSASSAASSEPSGCKAPPAEQGVILFAGEHQTKVRFCSSGCTLILSVGDSPSLDSAKSFVVTKVPKGKTVLRAHTVCCLRIAAGLCHAVQPIRGSHIRQGQPNASTQIIQQQICTYLMLRPKLVSACEVLACLAHSVYFIELGSHHNKHFTYKRQPTAG